MMDRVVDDLESFVIQPFKRPDGSTFYLQGINKADLDIVRSALSDAPVWRPIETAPKDGTRILGFCRDGVRREVWMADDIYEGAQWFDEGDTEPDPTHWMPLTPAPTEMAEAKEKEAAE